MSKKQLFEEMKFDNYQYALDVKQDAEERLAKGKSVFTLSIIGTILGCTAILIPAAIIVSIICYIKIGGFKTAVRYGWKLAKIGWFIVPIFPFDLFVGMMFFIMVPYFSLFFPIIIVSLFKRQAKKDLEQAEQYLKYCKPANEDDNA